MKFTAGRLSFECNLRLAPKQQRIVIYQHAAFRGSPVLARVSGMSEDFIEARHMAVVELAVYPPERDWDWEMDIHEEDE